MVQSQFSLSWESYKSNICNGLSAFQQNGEFVDMTLAADGYYVKVHQVLMALASPYLKELISSAPCQHPVVFLNNVSYKTLSSLLEYIYTGETLIAADNLPLFTEAAKALHIKGLENFTGSDTTMKMAAPVSQMEDGEFCHVSGIKRMAVPGNNREKIGLPAAERKICIKQESPLVGSAIPKQKYKIHQPHTVAMGLRDDTHDYEALDDSALHDDDDSALHDDDDDNGPNHSLKAITKGSNLAEEPSKNLQFTVSIRGSLQIILNRYLYNLHSSGYTRGVRRWRCVDYRNRKCSAFVVTKGNVVLNRENLHNHPFHDKKILAKVEKKCVYSALDEVQGYKEKEDPKSAESDDYTALDDDFTNIRRQAERLDTSKRVN